MKTLITNLTISVPYKRAGNVISQQPVAFNLYRESNNYLLEPCLDSQELAIANLPISLSFVVENGKPVSLRGKKDGNFHVIQDAFNQLHEQQLLNE